MLLMRPSIGMPQPVPRATARSISAASRNRGTAATARWAAEDRPGFEQTAARPRTLREHVIEQIGTDLTDQGDQLIALHLLDLLDETGYLRGALDGVALLLGCDSARVEAVLARLQQFDPPGIFARDLPECLALQLRDRDRLDPAMQTLLDNLPLARHAQHRRADAGVPGRCRGRRRDDRRDQIARPAARASPSTRRWRSRWCPTS